MASLFVSHGGSDAAAAERLATELRARGHDVWLDVWNIHTGDSVIERINRGLDATRYLVLCYSDVGVTSPWMSREWMSALARQLEGAGIQILPVRLTGGAPPAILADLKYADFTRDWNAAMAELCAAIK